MSGTLEQTLHRTGAITLDTAMRFLWTEAEMLDRLDYKAWLKIWADEGLYIIPTERDAADHAASLNIAYDDKVMREARVKRLLSGFSMSSAPPARTVRTLSRFVVKGEAADTITVTAAMLIAEYKYERMRLLAADVDYTLLRRDGALLMGGKIVRLINCDDYLHGLGYLM